MSTKYNFARKVALVTRSSSGIGAAVALSLAKYGARLAITGRNGEALSAVAAKIEASGSPRPVQVVGDLVADGDLPARLIDETVKEFGQLDVLVNNAGGATPNGTINSPDLLQEFDSVMQLNVRSVLQLTHLAAPHLSKTRGNIVNISSVAGMRPLSTVYSVSKAALDMMTQTTAKELASQGIRVNSVNPGPVKTGFGRSIGVPDIYTDLEEFMIRQTALRRLPGPEEIAKLVVMLASDDAANITGSIFVSDGGSLLQAAKHR